MILKVPHLLSLIKSILPQKKIILEDLFTKEILVQKDGEGFP